MLTVRKVTRITSILGMATFRASPCTDYLTTPESAGIRRNLVNAPVQDVLFTIAPTPTLAVAQAQRLAAIRNRARSGAVHLSNLADGRHAHSLITSRISTLEVARVNAYLSERLLEVYL